MQGSAPGFAQTILIGAHEKGSLNAITFAKKRKEREELSLQRTKLVESFFRRVLEPNSLHFIDFDLMNSILFSFISLTINVDSLMLALVGGEGSQTSPTFH